ncbi:hypothetical protein GMES_0893 [Paraglaciecola mesophila KMM 241]|uniref:DUF2785 domain-containing protein n=2 Tax=Paraglaciecola mesophila TaxID=197222 RepID=K6Z2H6_9ALTE|nr:hypothetical protein GMES_0893 [Paraglaciecola mesophila KMM 241]|tara:strand:- start:8763 stop:9740 length:978 start_codon:yes stop_codon:yes gene_type:complete
MLLLVKIILELSLMLSTWLLNFFCFAFLICSFLTHADNERSKIDEETCFSNSWNKEKLLDLKNNQFLLSNQGIHELLPQLRYCLASSDPIIRDDVAFGAYSTWLRAGNIRPPTLSSLFETFLSDIDHNKNDEQSVFLPFAILVFSEVLRVDRKSPYLQASQRIKAVNALSSYMLLANDYRGFDDQLGWRHSVAHTSDAIFQLVLNPKINQAQLQQMLNAIAQQIPAQGSHFYIYAEPERLSRPVYYAMRREDVPIKFWEQWISNIADPSPFKSWAEVFTNQQGLAQRHNVKLFLLNLQYFIVAGKGNEQLGELNIMVKDALKSMI